MDQTQSQQHDSQLSVFGTCPRTEEKATIQENSANLFCSECILTLGHKIKDDSPYETSKKHFRKHIVEVQLDS